MAWSRLHDGSEKSGCLPQFKSSTRSDVADPHRLSCARAAREGIIGLPKMGVTLLLLFLMLMLMLEAFDAAFAMLEGARSHPLVASSWEILGGARARAVAGRSDGSHARVSGARLDFTQRDRGWR